MLHVCQPIGTAWQNETTKLKFLSEEGRTSNLCALCYRSRPDVHRVPPCTKYDAHPPHVVGPNKLM